MPQRMRFRPASQASLFCGEHHPDNTHQHHAGPDADRIFRTIIAPRAASNDRNDFGAGDSFGLFHRLIDGRQIARQKRRLPISHAAFSRLPSETRNDCDLIARLSPARELPLTSRTTTAGIAAAIRRASAKTAAAIAEAAARSTIEPAAASTIKTACGTVIVAGTPQVLAVVVS